MKRAADLAEALYSMPRTNQLMSAPRSPSMSNNGMSAGFNTYTGQLAVSVQENGNGQWTEGAYPSKELRPEAARFRNPPPLAFRANPKHFHQITSMLLL